MINYEDIHSDFLQHNSKLSYTLADKRNKLNKNSKTAKDDMKELVKLEKEINLNYGILKNLMKLSLLQKVGHEKKNN